VYATVCVLGGGGEGVCLWPQHTHRVYRAHCAGLLRPLLLVLLPSLLLPLLLLLLVLLL